MEWQWQLKSTAEAINRDKSSLAKVVFPREIGGDVSFRGFFHRGKGHFPYENPGDFRFSTAFSL